jgi:SAM-dependent methyltransferase
VLGDRERLIDCMLLTSNERRRRCPICEGALAVSRHEWMLRCVDCGFLCSQLHPNLNDAKRGLDEHRRAAALRNVRQHNFAVLLDIIQASCPSGLILEVGCGHGWFLQQAIARGYYGVGIEPDLEIAEIAKSRCGDIRTGSFPDAIRADEKFDIIAFNDVLEHIPAVDDVLTAARAHLRQSGLLVLNLPLSSGIFYRVADLLDRAGISGPLARMWQINFPSPHLSYFNAQQLITLAERQGFHRLKATHLRSLDWHGLWQRLRYDRSQSALGAATLWLLLMPIIPILHLLPPDVGVFLFARNTLR